MLMKRYLERYPVHPVRDKDGATHFYVSGGTPNTKAQPYHEGRGFDEIKW